MKERPILFSAPMVRAILEGRKTQTRRAARGVQSSWKVALSTMEAYVWHACDPDENPTGPSVFDKRLPSPYGTPGDRLWVKETWAAPPVYNAARPLDIPDGAPILRKADEPVAGGAVTTWRWRPSIFMRRWMSRITLEVTGVRVERLHDITEEDAKAEAAPLGEDSEGGKSYALGFCDLWHDINGAESWAANPWVWVVSFKVVRP